VRLGADRPPEGGTAALSVRPGANQQVIDGGPGGFDPTAGGPGGGLPAACSRSNAGRARIGGRIRGAVKRLNRGRSLTLAFSVSRGPVCDVGLKLLGPGGHVYASSQAIRLKTGRGVVRLQRVRRLARGGYRLDVSGVSSLGQRVRVRTDVRGTLS
jgi:hypothetical protein